MEKIKVVSFWGTETNPSADPETAGDGGGYFQPSGGCVLSTPGCREVLVEYEDANCGDFGTREFWTVSAPSRRLEWRWAQGSMDDDSIDPYWFVEQVRESLAGALGVDHRVFCNTVREAVNLAAYRMNQEVKA